MNASLVLYALMLLVVIISIGKWRGANSLIEKLGVRRTNIGKELFTAFIYLGFLVIVSVFIGAVMAALGFQDDLQQVTDVLIGIDLGTILVTLTVASFIEEFFFRGYLQRKTNIVFASFIFAYFHVIYGSLSEMVGAFFLGLILGEEYRRTNNLFAPILSHFFYNIVIIILMVSG